MTAETPSVICLNQHGLDEHLQDLARILHECVNDGASVSFVLPFTLQESRDFWIDKVRPSVAAGETILIAAKFGRQIVGTVQLQCATQPNQPHRAEVTKLLVAPGFQRRGVAKALMGELEQRACNMNRSLITLDTRTGDKAEPLYSLLGYRTAGVIPLFARNPVGDKFHATTLMFKQL